jgi:hypothetical protein
MDQETRHRVQAERHVTETRLRLERQQILVARLAPDHPQFPLAKRMLTSLEEALREQEHHLAIIKRWD